MVVDNSLEILSIFFYWQRIKMSFHPSIFEHKLSDIINNTDPLFFNRTLETIDEQRRVITGGSNPKQSTVYDTKCSKDSYRNSNAYSSIQERNVINDLYFSTNNIQQVQNMIRYTVHKHANYIIGNQSEAELLIVMRAIYLQYAANPIITETIKQKKLIYEEIERLNNIVVNDIVPSIVSNTQQYLNYLEDISKISMPHARGKNESVKGTKQFRDISDIFNI
jgi:hypothetical protein